jgi:putative methionine-R-sulfoxide reductase with GAF domain
MRRDYEGLMSRIEVHPDRDRAARAFVDITWEALHATGISWLGFYLHGSADALVLGPCRNKPACSPIGMHGACGRALSGRRVVLVHDVSELGENYIACDPRDRSELVIPLFDGAGRCWGVFDADSHAVGAFSEADAEGFTALLRKAGLTHP